jgi:hypothetical protein
MVDESIVLLRRCTHASVRRMDLQILCPALSRDGDLLAESGGDLIERSGLQWLLITYAHTYATVIPQ